MVIALGVIALLVIASLFGVIPLSIAVVLHEGSTLVVVLNALRLLAWRERPAGPQPSLDLPERAGGF
jgi:Cd2+/Zn2+-exporting ATPase